VSDSPGGLRDRLIQMRTHALACLANGDYKTALADLRIVTALTPRDNEAQKGYAAALIRSGKHKEGVTILRKVAEATPDDIELHCVIGELLATMLEYAEAKTHLDRCLALDPKSDTPHGVRARVLYRRMQRALENQLGQPK
jgi:Flp pilus assembly protein TadD